MKETSQLEDDKIIAKFLGYEYFHPGVDIDDSDCGGIYDRYPIYSKIPIEVDEYPDEDQYYFDNNWYRLDNHKNWYRNPDYRGDWNWLMKVIPLCTLRSGDTEMESIWDVSTQFELQMGDIDKVYRAVIEFINWYNETKCK